MTASIKANVDGSAAIQVGGTDVITLTSGGAATFVTSPTTVQAGTAAAPSITTSGDTNTGIFFPAADTIAFAEGGVESGRFDSSGRLLVGTSTAITSWGSGAAQQIQATASGVAYPGFSSYSFNNTAGAGGLISLGHSRGATVGTMTATQSGDILGYLIFEGVNSSNALTGGAYIQVSQTAAAGASYIPGSMLFFTSDATNGNAERARFNSTGAFVFAGGTSTADGIGITFPATQSASSNANTLDDYEEGTYTPQIVVEGGNPLNASTVYEGSYTKIGNTVRVTVHAVWNNVTAAGGTSAIQLHNFPFPFALTSNAEGTQAYGTHFSTGIAGLNQVLNLRPVQNNVTWCYLYGFWGTTLPQTYGYLRVNSNPITNGTAMTLQFVIVYRTTQ